MSAIDQFESAFRSASRETYHFKRIPITRILIVCDLNGDDATTFAESIKPFLAHLGLHNTLDWQILNGDQFNSAEDLLERVQNIQPDMICTYRNLHTRAWQFPHSLGVHLDILLQRTPVPVMVVPHPEANLKADHALNDISSVMAMTSHINRDHRLIDYAASMTQDNGTLYLAHIEDKNTFERYMEAISKISAIPTDQARELLSKQLLKDPLEYIGSCKKGLTDAEVNLTLKPIVSFGKHLSEFKQHIESHTLCLLIMNAKDEEQMAMHGLAYSLAIEFRHIPLLIL